MQIQVLVSTHADRIHGVPRVVASLPADTDVLVLHQTQAGAAYAYEDIFREHPNVRVVASQERGLARSRNVALSHATADIVLPTDDDVLFLPGAMATIRGAFESNPAADAITFQIQTPDGRPYKRYATTARQHSVLTIKRVSSIEIALRREVMQQRKVSWDERFGLNGTYGGGLELAFMRNLLAAGCKARYEPVPIIVHPDESTGHRHTAASGFFRGAVYAKLYGRWAYPLLVGFAAKNAWRTGSAGAATSYTRNLFRGATDFLRSERSVTHRPNP